MDQLKLLADALEQRQAWPPLNLAGDDLRRLAVRRRRWRNVIVTSTVLALAAVLVNGAASGLFTPNPAAVTPAGGGATRTVYFLGAKLSIPSSWTERSEATTASIIRTCVGPAEASGRCPLLVSVAAEPDKVLIDGGLDLVPSITADCHRDDPKIVNVEEMIIDGRKARHFVAKCEPESAPVNAWTLDSGAFAITVVEDRWAAQAAEIFSTLRVPDAWPAATESPSQSSAEPSQP